jgi:hypothetical protein
MRPVRALILVLCCAAPASGQTVLTPRADLQSGIGWQNLSGQPTPGGAWMHGIVLADGAAGWYWTEHLRTQIDAGIGSHGRQVRTVPRTSTDRQAFDIVISRVQPVSFTVTQQYQFFHNAWFHPHLGAGIQVRRDRFEEQHEATVAFDEDRQQWVQLQPAFTDRFTRTRVAAAIDGGFKAYLSRRAFFVGDARFTVRRTLDGVLFRAGLGIDF